MTALSLQPFLCLYCSRSNQLLTGVAVPESTLCRLASSSSSKLPGKAYSMSGNVHKKHTKATPEI